MLVFSELEVAYLENVESLPVTNLQKGRIVWDETNTRASIYTGSGWRHVVDTVSALSNPMSAVGDIIKGGTSGAAERLAIGSANTYLKSNGSTPGWGSLDAATDSTPGTISKEYDSGWLTYSETMTKLNLLVFLGSLSLPTGTTTHRYRWTRLGNVVSIWIRAQWSNSNGVIEGVEFPIPSAVTPPSIPSGSNIELPASLLIYGNTTYKTSCWVHSHTNGTKYIRGYLNTNNENAGTNISGFAAFASYTV